MYQMSSWEAQTQHLIEVVESKIKEMESDFETHIAPLKQRKWALEESLRAYSEIKGHAVDEVISSLTPEDILNKGPKALLLVIAKKNNGLLVVNKAVKAMKALNVFSNPNNGASIVYSALKRSHEFVKVGSGVYKLDEKLTQSITVEPKSQSRVNSGVRQAVKDVKEHQPEMTKREVVDFLTRTGFDFKGKRPINAVNMAWAYLGYSKQQLPEQKTLETVVPEPMIQKTIL